MSKHPIIPDEILPLVIQANKEAYERRIAGELYERLAEIEAAMPWPLRLYAWVYRRISQWRR